MNRLPEKTKFDGWSTEWIPQQKKENKNSLINPSQKSHKNMKNQSWP